MGSGVSGPHTCVISILLTRCPCQSPVHTVVLEEWRRPGPQPTARHSSCFRLLSPLFHMSTLLGELIHWWLCSPRQISTQWGWRARLTSHFWPVTAFIWCHRHLVGVTYCCQVVTLLSRVWSALSQSNSSDFPNSQTKVPSLKATWETWPRQQKKGWWRCWCVSVFNWRDHPGNTFLNVPAVLKVTWHVCLAPVSFDHKRVIKTWSWMWSSCTQWAGTHHRITSFLLLCNKPFKRVY